MVGANEIDGLRTIELIFAAYKSANTGKRVNIKHRDLNSVGSLV